MFDIEFLMVVVPLLLLVGAAAGVLAGLLGVGGGIVIVPALYLLTELGLLDVDASMAIHFAVATSLATIIPTSISSSRAHHKRGSVDFALFRQWAPFIALGAFGGGILASNINANAMTAVFGVVATLVVINMLNPRPLTLAEHPPKTWWSRALISSPIGAISAMMGIGGGTLSVPALTLCGIAVHRAVGTAALFGLVIALPGVLAYAMATPNSKSLLPYSVGFINLPAAIIISCATFAFAPLGARLAHALDARKLRIAFAVFLGLSAAKMLWESFGG